jgi:uncharacterized protein YegJ (DUF2314 family)
MRRLSPALLLSMLLLGACAKESVPVVERDGEPVVGQFENKDAGMNAAIQKARATLSEYERRLSHPPSTQTDISLKGRFEVGEHVEHMWVKDVEVTAKGYRGTLANSPLNIQSMDSGDVVLVRPDEVSDWMAVDDGKLVGGYTIRLMRDRVGAERRGEFDDSLSFVIED